MNSSVRPSVATIWGIFGFIALLGQAVYRLTPLALEPIFEGGMTPLQWGIYALSIGFTGYTEGYRAFHKQVAPRVVARGFVLAEQTTLVRSLLAPLFCIGLFHATRKRIVISWTVYLAIIAVVIAVRQLDQPWRGIVDSGVVVGLAMGCISILYFFARAMQGHALPGSAELPTPTT